MDSVESFKQRMNSPEAKYVGNSDSGNIMFIDEILDEFPNAKMVLIERPMDEVAESLVSAGFPESWDYLRLCQNDLAELKVKARPMVVNFHRLDHEACKDIWNYVTDGSPLNEARLEMLEAMRIEVIPEIITNKVMKNMGQFMDLIERVH